MKSCSICAKAKECGCLSCEHQRLGFPSDPSWDACDYTCNDGAFSHRMFCSHGMTTKQIRKKLKEYKPDCDKWKPSENTWCSEWEEKKG